MDKNLIEFIANQTPEEVDIFPQVIEERPTISDYVDILLESIDGFRIKIEQLRLLDEEDTSNEDIAALLEEISINTQELMEIRLPSLNPIHRKLQGMLGSIITAIKMWMADPKNNRIWTELGTFLNSYGIEYPGSMDAAPWSIDRKQKSIIDGFKSFFAKNIEEIKKQEIAGAGVYAGRNITSIISGIFAALANLGVKDVNMLLRGKEPESIPYVDLDVADAMASDPRSPEDRAAAAME